VSRKVVIILAADAVFVVLTVWALRFPTWRLFFGWPTGGTWSNAIEQVAAAALIGSHGWLARDHIGRKLAAWWAKHHGPHAIEQHKQALREHEEAKAGGYDHSEA
jgi:hypothetical protein